MSNTTLLNAPIAQPLILGLDGTLIATDLLAESLLNYLKINPFRVVFVMAWMLRGFAYLRNQLANASTVDLNGLPIREDVVAYAVAEAQAGRSVHIATAADDGLAKSLKGRFVFVSDVIGSFGTINLNGIRKAEFLTARFPQGFIYIGSAAADLPVWRAAAQSIFAGGSSSVCRRIEEIKPLSAKLPARSVRLRDWVKVLRLHQWTKNTLLFVPLILGGAARLPGAWVSCLLGFLAMGLLASGTYVLNDLVDLEDDRQHWTKCRRAFASGLLPISAGLLLFPVGLIAGLAVGWRAHHMQSLFMLSIYLATTLAYSFRLKQIPILDVLVLGGLFTLRLAIGVECSGVAWSPWLLVFSMFIFSSLSLAKRSTEIKRLKERGGSRLAGRGYLVTDEPLVLALGVSLSSSGILVMVMYLVNEAFQADFYRTPALLWILPIVLSLWLGRIWLLCCRGTLNDDPVIFAVRDVISLALAMFITLTVLAAVLL